MDFIFTQYVSDKLSRKILDQALEQQDELQAEYGNVTSKRGKKALAEARTSLGGLSKPSTAGSEDESDSDEDEFSEGEDQYYEDVVSKPRCDNPLRVKFEPSLVLLWLIILSIIIQ